MKYLLLALGGLFAALLLASVITASSQDRYDPVDYARQEAEIARLEAQAARERALAPLDLTMAALWRLAPFVVAVGGLAYLGALGAAHVTRVRSERMPRADGLLPVRAADLRSVAPAALGAWHQTEHTRAGVAPVPHSLSLHWAPRQDYRADGAAGSGLALGAPDEPTALSVPTFAQLLDSGRVGRGNPLLLGFDLDNNGAEIAGSWTDLYATATAGLPGSGKTTSQRFFACQTALHGARFAVCDPHAGAADDSLAATLAPLARLYLVEPASEPKRILETVQCIADIGERRVKGLDRDTTPIILWVDELTGLLGRSDVGDPLAELLERIAQEYRKRFVYLSASGQIWTAARATSELRDSLASVLCHRMKRSQARLLLPVDEATTVERLATGEAVLWRTSGATARVKIPLTTAQDVVRVAERLTDTSPTMERLSVIRSVNNQSGFSHTAASDYSASESLAAPSAEAARIVALFLSGKDAAAIVTELTGMTSKAGRPYLDKLTDVQAAIRAALAAQREG